MQFLLVSCFSSEGKHGDANKLMVNRPFDMYHIDHKLDRARFPNMPMARDKVVRDYFGSQVYITTSGHFSTQALLCAMAEIGARRIMFSIDYPFESIPNGCVGSDEHV